MQVIVVANGCNDDKVGEAKANSDEFPKRGWQLDVLDLPERRKIGALGAGDKAAVLGGPLRNADHIHDNGHFIGNHHTPMDEAIEALTLALDASKVG